MKYESSILKRLIDTYGVIGNPRYLSEIIKEFIVRGKELYPHLFTYQSDWLAHIDEFGLTPDYVVSYTGQHIYAPNTKEKPVKSAILKGNTLVNVVSSYGFGGDNKLYESRFFERPFNAGETFTIFVVNPNISAIKIGKHGIGGGWLGVINQDVSINKKLKFTVPENQICKYVGVVVTNENDSIGFENGLVIVAGDQTHLDIDTYFEGMQSVKMPVLTTSNEDGTKTNILTVNEDVVLRGIGDVQDELDLLTGEVTERIGEIVLDGSQQVTKWNNTLEQPNTLTWNITIDDMMYNSNILSDKLKFMINPSVVNNVDEEAVSTGASNKLYIRLNKSRGLTEADVMNNLSQNPITVSYQLATESIKTVDLTIHDKDHQKVERLTSFDGGTHFTTSSQEGSLLPTLTVYVLTDLEETLMVCSLEGNTV